MNEETEPPVRFPADGEWPGSEPAIAELTFRKADLPGVREFAAARARGHGADEDTIRDLLIAVNEIATNAVTHGAPPARLRMWAGDGHLYVSVHDEGHWHVDGPPGHTPPPPHATRGMGLWVARRLSGAITFTTGATGTTVTMRFQV